MEQNTETPVKAKTSKTRANSKMTCLIECWNQGIKDIPSIAKKFEEAELSGVITGLKHTSPDFLAKKDHNYYKKLVNWYLYSAKIKGLIDAPMPVKRPRKAKAEAAPVVLSESQPETTPASEPVSETATANTEDTLLPSI